MSSILPLRDLAYEARLVGAGPGLIAGDQFATATTPFGFAIDRVVGDRTQRADQLAVERECGSGEARARRLIHERHEHVGEARHRAANTDAAHVRTAANAGHPSALGHVAIHYRAPAADFHQALRCAV